MNSTCRTTAMLLALAALAWGEPIPPASVELAGNFAFASTSIEDDEDPSQSLVVNPLVRLYPTSFFFAGPDLEYLRSWRGTSSMSGLSIGAHAGLITQVSEGGPYAYGGVGGGFATANSDGSRATSQDGSYLTGFLGLKFPLGESFFINLQPTWIRQSQGELDATRLAMHIGFSGIIQR